MIEDFHIKLSHQETAFLIIKTCLLTARAGRLSIRENIKMTCKDVNRYIRILGGLVQFRESCSFSIKLVGFTGKWNSWIFWIQNHVWFVLMYG